MKAVESQNLTLVKILIDSRANLEIQDVRGWSALTLACVNNYKECTNLIFDAGALVQNYIIHYHHYIILEAKLYRNEIKTGYEIGNKIRDEIVYIPSVERFIIYENKRRQKIWLKIRRLNIFGNIKTNCMDNIILDYILGNPNKNKKEFVKNLI